MLKFNVYVLNTKPHEAGKFLWFSSNMLVHSKKHTTCSGFTKTALNNVVLPTWLDNQPGVVFTQSSTLISYTPEYNNAFTS